MGKLTDVSLVIYRSGYLFKHPCVNPFLVWLNHPIGYFIKAAAVAREMAVIDWKLVDRIAGYPTC